MAIFFLFVGQNQHSWYQMTCNGAGFPEIHNLLCFQSTKNPVMANLYIYHDLLSLDKTLSVPN